MRNDTVKWKWWQWTLFILFFVLFVGWGIAANAWLARNPKANQFTVFSHFDDVIHFRKLEKFQ